VAGNELAAPTPAEVVAEAVGLAASAIALPDGATLTPIGIIGLPAWMQAADTVALASGLLRRFAVAMNVGNVLMWAVGDAYAHGERLHGSDFEDAMAASGYAPQTISNALWVARNVPYTVRRGDLSWTHHEVVAALEPGVQRAWLLMAAEGDWSTRQLAAELREARDRDEGVDPGVGRAVRALERASHDVAELWSSQWTDALIDGLLSPLEQMAPSPDGWHGFLVALRERIDGMLEEKGVG